jgi:hypothetical protein
MNTPTFSRTLSFAALTLGLVAFAPAATVEERLAALEAKTTQQQALITSLQIENTNLKTWKNAAVPKIEVAFDRTRHMFVSGTDTIFRGTNVYIQKGAAAGDVSVNGLGNLIIGFNNPRPEFNTRSGSHNIIYGDGVNYTGHHNLIGGYINSLGGNYNAILSGRYNRVSSPGDTFSVLLTGQENQVFSKFSLQGTGILNRNERDHAMILGGRSNLITNGTWNAGNFGAIVTGENNTVTADAAAILTGRGNRATAPGAALGSADGRISMTPWSLFVD